MNNVGLIVSYGATDPQGNTAPYFPQSADANTLLLAAVDMLVACPVFHEP
jgi:hypothetical protein